MDVFCEEKTDVITRENVFTDSILKNIGPCVLILKNDDITPIDYVITVLVYACKKEMEDAINIAMKANNEGSSLIGFYPKKTALSIIEVVNELNKDYNHALQIVIEED